MDWSTREVILKTDLIIFLENRLRCMVLIHSNIYISIYKKSFYDIAVGSRTKNYGFYIIID